MRSVVVTGASTGIGEACALALDRAGWRVFAGVRRTADGERLCTQCSPNLVPLIIDVTDGASIAAAADQIRGATGERGLDGLVNNAGIAVAGPLELLPIEDLRRQLEVNVIGQVAVTQALLPLLRAGRGRVVFMSSIAGRMAIPFLGPYAASKHALEALADALRLELAPWGIEIAVVEPGSVATPIWEKSVAASEEMSARYSPGAAADYSAEAEIMRRAAIESGRRGVPASRVADAVFHALTSPSPRTRYLVGRDARFRAWIAALVPDRLRDRLVARALKLPKHG